MAEPDADEAWIEKHLRPALPGWTRHRKWLMSPVEDDLVRVFEVVIYCSRVTLEAWVAPVFVPWQAPISIRSFFRVELPGAWGQRPQDVPKIRGAIGRFLPKFEPTRTLARWVAVNKKYHPPGGPSEGTLEAIALPLIALGEYDQAAKWLDRALAKAKRFKPINEDDAKGARRFHERLAAFRAALARDPADARRKLAEFRRQNVKRFGLAVAAPARAGR